MMNVPMVMHKVSHPVFVHHELRLPVVMMHLMNSRLTMMALLRPSTAGGELAGAASSSRRSRACHSNQPVSSITSQASCLVQA